MKRKTETWKQHLEITKDYPPSPLLIQALPFVERKERAIDIGAGGLKDTRLLLEQGFDVTVVDSEKFVKELGDSIASSKLHIYISPLEKFSFPKDTFDLATGMFSLPFIRPQSFNDVFANIKISLRKGGIVCGQLFGIRDSFSGDHNMTFHTKIEVERLLSDLEVLVLKEQEKDSKTASGALKHWHIFHFIARRK